VKDQRAALIERCRLMMRGYGNDHAIILLQKHEADQFGLTAIAKSVTPMYLCSIQFVMAEINAKNALNHLLCR
jgi:hypothetical protein